MIGAAKAGTTTLCHHLRRHPEIFFSPRKELHYFSFEPTHAQGLEWYEAWFEGSQGYPQRGEGSTSYSGHGVFPLAAERIAAYEPRFKLIYIVRDPLRRIESVWLQLRRFGATSPYEDVGMHEVPLEMQVDLDFNRAVRLQSKALVESTNYWREIGVYRRLFPDEQILVLLFEDLQRDPRGTLRRCFEFLGVDPDFELEDERAHLNSMHEYSHPRELLWRLWSSPRRRRIYSSAARAVPIPVRRWLNRRLLRTAVERRPSWEPATRAWVWEQLEQDSRRLLEFYGLRGDAWELPGGAPATRD